MAGCVPQSTEQVEDGELLSLLKQIMEDCQLYDKTTVRSETGGYKYVWTPGVEFKAAIEQASTQEQMLAEQKGLSEAFTVVTERGLALDYHDVFKRKSDGAIFRVTSKSQASHPASTIKISRVDAERLETMPSVSNS